VGIVAKQTIKSSVYAYLGIVLGGINVAILYPRILSEEQIGLINILLAMSAVFAQFSSLGINGVTNYFFHYFNDKVKGHNGFFNIMALVSIVGFAGFLLAYVFFKDQIFISKAEESTLLTQYGIYLIPLTFFSLAFLAMDIYAAVLRNSVIGTFLKDFIFRILNLILIVAFYFEQIDFSQFLFAYTMALGIPPIVIFIELAREGHISFKRPDKKLLHEHRKGMISVGKYYIFTGLGTMLITYVDKYMINLFLGLAATGIYSITNYVGTLVQIPRRAMGKVAAPLLANLWAKKDLKQIQYFYKRSSTSQLILGIYIFMGIWANIDAVFQIIPQNYESGKWVVFFIGLSNIFHCFLGLGGLLITTSPLYKASTYFTFILGLLVVITNLIFVPLWGISGAAMASALSRLIFVVLNLLFLHRQLGIQPLLKEHITIPAAALLTYLPVLVIAPHWHWLLLFATKGVAITVIYLFWLRVFGILPNLKQFLRLPKAGR
jgi:O-antigen/teichoic acid export membrane protein